MRGKNYGGNTVGKGDNWTVIRFFGLRTPDFMVKSTAPQLNFSPTLANIAIGYNGGFPMEIIAAAESNRAPFSMRDRPYRMMRAIIIGTGLWEICTHNYLTCKKGTKLGALFEMKYRVHLPNNGVRLVDQLFVYTKKYKPVTYRERYRERCTV